MQERLRDTEHAQHTFQTSTRQAHDVGADALQVEADPNAFGFPGGMWLVLHCCQNTISCLLEMLKITLHYLQ